MEKTVGHVLALGDCGAEALRTAGHPDARAVHDEFSFGPLCDHSDEPRFWDNRLRYWMEVMGDEAPPIAEVRQKGQEDEILLDTVFRSGEAVEVWASQSVQDLIFLAQCAVRAKPGTQLTLRRPGPGSNAPPFGLGAFPLAQLGQDAPAHVLSEEELEALKQFWQAVISPDPDLLTEIALSQPTNRLGLEQAAAIRLQRFPDQTSGLDCVEKRVLVQIQKLGPEACSVAAAIGATLRAGDDSADVVGDLSLFYTIRKLASDDQPAPLLTLTEDGSMRGSHVSLTEFGEQVLSGAQDRIARNGWAIELGGLSVDVGPGGDVPRAPS